MRGVWGRSLLLAAVGFGLGGVLGYGKLVETAMATADPLQISGVWIELWLIGALWGGMGMTFLGFAVSERDCRLPDLAVLFLPITLMIGLHEQFDWPELTVFAGFLLFLHVYNCAIKRSQVVARFGGCGLLGGFAFTAAVLILWFGHQNQLAGSWWQLRDQFWGVGIGLMVIVAHRFLRDYSPQAQPGSLRRIVDCLGWLALLVAVFGLNAGNVWHHWYLQGFIGEAAWVWGRWGFIVFIALGVWFWLKRWYGAENNQRLLSGLFLTALWFLGGLAVAKETVPAGWSRWEPGFTWILAGMVFLSLMAPRALSSADQA